MLHTGGGNGWKKVSEMPERKPAKAAKDNSIQPRYLTLAQAGQYCGGRSAEAMRMMARRGRIHVTKQGARTLVDRLEIDRIMQESTLEIPA